MSISKPVARWDGPSTCEYLSLLVEHSEKQLGKLPKNPTFTEWIGILKVKCGTDFNIGQLKSKYHRIRIDYQVMCFLKSHTGLGWDEEKQAVITMNEQWSDFLKVHPTLNYLRNGLSNLDMYEIVWGSSSAIGNLAVPFVNPCFGRNEGAASDDDLDSQDDLTMDIGPRSREKQPWTYAQVHNKRNKGKAKISYEDCITAMATAYIAKQERYVSLRESRQTGLQLDEQFEQVTEIVTTMSEFTCRQRVKALEHIRPQLMAYKMFIKFPHEMRIAYIQEVLQL